MAFKRYLLAGLSISMLLAACSTSFPSLKPVFPYRAPLHQMNTEQAIVVQFHWGQATTLYDLAGAGLDIFGIEPERQRAKARVRPQDLKLLEAKKVPFRRIFEKDMEVQGGMPTGYMSYADMVQRLQALAQQYPHLTTLKDVGDTWEKQAGQSPTHDIWRLTITGQKSDKPKPAALFTGGVHARELAPVEILIKLAELLLSQYGKDPRTTALLDSREIVFLPMVNVDGRVAVQNGNTWQRKNMHGTGVDLNRNYDFRWNYDGLNVPNSWKQGLLDPHSEIYSGTGPASEPEIQTIQQMYQQYPVKLLVDMHAYGEMMLWPLGYSTDDIPEATHYRQIWGDTFKPLGFRGGTSAQILYPTTATGRDYGYGRHGAFTMTLEIGKSFRPSYREVEQMWTELHPRLLTLIEKVVN